MYFKKLNFFRLILRISQNQKKKNYDTVFFLVNVHVYWSVLKQLMKTCFELMLTLHIQQVIFLPKITEFVKKKKNEFFIRFVRLRDGFSIDINVRLGFCFVQKYRNSVEIGQPIWRRFELIFFFF